MHGLCLHSLTTLACLQSAAKAGEQTQPEMQSPAPIAAPQMSPCPAGFLDTAPAGVPQGSTPATAPRAANPAAFLRTPTAFSALMCLQKQVWDVLMSFMTLRG